MYQRSDSLHAQRQPGYNETVDLWSIGCLAGTLITNSFLFPPERSVHSQETIDNDTQHQDAFDLSFLDTSAEWKSVSDKCKSFIRGCVMLDETHRMSVSQALEHSWVAHPGFAAAMQAEYARAVADWKPRANTQDLIEYVKDPVRATKAPEPGYEARLHQEVRSHYFAPETSPLPSNTESFDFSAYTAREPLSPIDDCSRQTASRGNHGLPNATDTKRSVVEDNMSYLSIQDYAPPSSYPAIGASEQCSQEQFQWDQRLATSIYEQQPVEADGAVARKKMRV